MSVKKKRGQHDICTIKQHHHHHHHHPIPKKIIRRGHVVVPFGIETISKGWMDRDDALCRSVGRRQLCRLVVDAVTYAS